MRFQKEFQTHHVEAIARAMWQSKPKDHCDQKTAQLARWNFTVSKLADMLGAHNLNTFSRESFYHRCKNGPMS